MWFIPNKAVSHELKIPPDVACIDHPRAQGKLLKCKRKDSFTQIANTIQIDFSTLFSPLKIIFASNQWTLVEPLLRTYFEKSINGGWVQITRQKPEVEVLVHGSNTFIRMIEKTVNEKFYENHDGKTRKAASTGSQRKRTHSADGSRKRKKICSELSNEMKTGLPSVGSARCAKKRCDRDSRNSEGSRSDENKPKLVRREKNPEIIEVDVRPSSQQDKLERKLVRRVKEPDTPEVDAKKSTARPARQLVRRENIPKSTDVKNRSTNQNPPERKLIRRKKPTKIEEPPTEGEVPNKPITQKPMTTQPAFYNYEKEENKRRVSQRIDQIRLGKRSEGYKNYIRLVPKEKRQYLPTNERIDTPRADQKLSKRRFDGFLKKWKRSLYQWEGKTAADIRWRYNRR